MFFTLSHPCTGILKNKVPQIIQIGINPDWYGKYITSRKGDCPTCGPFSWFLMLFEFFLARPGAKLRECREYLFEKEM